MNRSDEKMSKREMRRRRRMKQNRNRARRDEFNLEASVARSPEEKRANRMARQKARSPQSGESKSGKRKADLTSKILMAICALIFCVSAFKLYGIYAEYKAGVVSYQEVTELGIIMPELEEGETIDDVGYEYYYVDFDALAEQNADIVAWIRFEDPDEISYPVVQTDDNSTYLTMNFQGEYNSSGALFVDQNNSGDFTDDNTVIYGHNMKNGSMFGMLSDYIEEEQYIEYPYFYIYTPDGMAAKYQIAVVEEVEADDTYRYTKNFDEAIDFEHYITEVFTTAFYSTGVSMNSSNQLITLSTCTADDEERFIVQAVKVEEREMVTNE